MSVPLLAYAQAATTQTLNRASMRRALAVTPAQLNPLRRVVENHTDTLSDTTRKFTIARGAFLVTAVEGMPRVDTAAGPPHYDLPFDLYGLNAAGVGVHFRVRFEVAGGGLHYDPTDGNFRGNLLVGLENVQEPTATESLSGTIRMQLTGPDTISPGLLALSHTNVPYDSVRLVATTRGDVLIVRIHPSFEPTGVDAQIPVRQPPFFVTASPKRIEGYGLETATLTFLGTARVPEDSLVVSLETERGAVGTTSLELARNHAATTTLRSRGVGPDRLTVTSARSDPMALAVTYVWPVAFLIAALLGGLVGALVARLRARRQARSALWLSYLSAGVLSGIVAAIAYGFGVNLLRIPVTIPYGSEGAVFLIAYLAGHRGIATVGNKVASVGHWLGGPAG